MEQHTNEGELSSIDSKTIHRATVFTERSGADISTLEQSSSSKLAEHSSVQILANGIETSSPLQTFRGGDEHSVIRSHHAIQMMLAAKVLGLPTMLGRALLSPAVDIARPYQFPATEDDKRARINDTYSVIHGRDSTPLAKISNDSKRSGDYEACMQSLVSEEQLQVNQMSAQFIDQVEDAPKLKCRDSGNLTHDNKDLMNYSLKLRKENLNNLTIPVDKVYAIRPGINYTKNVHDLATTKFNQHSVASLIMKKSMNHPNGDIHGDSADIRSNFPTINLKSSYGPKGEIPIPNAPEREHRQNIANSFKESDNQLTDKESQSSNLESRRVGSILSSYYEDSEYCNTHHENTPEGTKKTLKMSKHDSCPGGGLNSPPKEKLQHLVLRPTPTRLVSMIRSAADLHNAVLGRRNATEQHHTSQSQPEVKLSRDTCIAGLPQQHGDLIDEQELYASNKSGLIPTMPPVPRPLQSSLTQHHPFYHVPLHPSLHQASFVKLHHHLHYHYSSSSATREHPPSQQEEGPVLKKRRVTKGTVAPNGDREYTNPPLGVVLDIAACDGPVFFERVLNKSFAGNQVIEEVDSDAEIVVDDVDTEESGGSELRKVPAATHLPRCTTATYHCVYCNHTFKSHYCYQKHMRRHINPITTEVQPKAAVEELKEMRVEGESLHNSVEEENKNSEDGRGGARAQQVAGQKQYDGVVKTTNVESDQSDLQIKNTTEVQQVFGQLKNTIKEQLSHVKFLSNPEGSDAVSFTNEEEMSGAATTTGYTQGRYGRPILDDGSKERPTNENDGAKCSVDKGAGEDHLKHGTEAATSGGGDDQPEHFVDRIKTGLDIPKSGLDLNVQYFPCKTCGSKFPSYYFVHKHRRLCHGEQSDNVSNLVK